ncbi:MAG: ferrous iron transport protein B [Armatimonadetes bacterium]|nr:ferrous iron transport protein B [Armatimonadota bacterium]
MSHCHPATVEESSETALVGLVGNPNAGKTTVFNSLTGSFQKVGNYPGVTVEKVTGAADIGGHKVALIDVPGLYSLEAASEDERVALDVIEGRVRDMRSPDLLVYVMDASNLERNLYLFTHLAEARYPLVVALTMTDMLESEGARVDTRRMSDMLGVDVVPIVGHRGRGVRQLREAIDRNLKSPKRAERDFGFPVALEKRVEELCEQLALAGLDYPTSEVRQALLGGRSDVIRRVEEMPRLREAFEAAKADLETEGPLRPGLEAGTRYDWAAMVQKAVVRRTRPPKRLSPTDRLDWILTHRVFGLAVFLAIMYLVFQSIYTFALPVMDAVQWTFGRLSDLVSPALAGSPVIQSAVVDGLIAGLSAMMIFLPQILILFFFITLLEGTGYLARAAFLMDRLLGWCGLNGRAFIPLLSSFACAIPGVMAARVIPDPKSRLATILIAPLMSCSARLPIYLLLIGAFVEPQFGAAWAGFALFAMHLLGLLVAIPIVFVLNRGLIRGKSLPFVLELPPFQWPKWRDVWRTMFLRGKVFVKIAGTIIVAMSILIWALLYFPRPAGETAIYESQYATLPAEAREKVTQENFVQRRQIENSYLGRFGKTIEPVFRPAGFDWRLSTAILAAFPAREVVVPSLGIIFSLGGDVDQHSGDLRQALSEATWPDGRPLVTPWTAVGLMVFFALCCQCMGTLATVRRETNSWKWPLFMFAYMTALAYLAAVGINQLGRLVG